MIRRLMAVSIILLISFYTISNAQGKKKDEGIFKEKKGGYFKEIVKGIKEFETKEKPAKKHFAVDLSGWNLPSSVDEFTTAWHNEPISQGFTGTCWSFSTTSYFESEVYRLSGKKVKLSEMWTAYWEYVEKAKGFVNTRGKSLFSEGSEANAVTRIWKQYGIVPEDAFNGMLPGQKFHNHQKMFKEMNSFLQQVKKTNAWNEKEVVETIKSILNNYMGTPPVKVLIDGENYSPKEYLVKYLELNLDDYIDVLSIKQQPFYKKVEYEVPDNWWHNKDYYNIPIAEFMSIIKKSVRDGYTMCIGGDVSEPGKTPELDVAVIPSFDIPSDFIDDNARQFRFSNKTTTDDHGIHLVGFENKDGKDWYLIKDSASSARDGNNKGYYFFQEDYVKLKIMDFMIHKDAVKDMLKKFN